MVVKTLQGVETDLSQEVIDRFKKRLQGYLLFPGDAGFDESRSVWNAMIDRRPAIIVRPLGIPDVIACVQFARDHDLLLCIKGGGHNIAGLATADGALMIDMSLMRSVQVDSLKRIAHAQAGCLLGDVDRETQIHGLAAVLGFVSLTGIAGLTLGGGFGYLTRRWGWTADNLVGMDVVTADAKLVRASSDENQDLFWGLRGGGGNFGVVTGFDYMLHPVGPEAVGGLTAWPAEEAPRVLEFYRTLTEKAPPELTLLVILRNAPPSPWLPSEWHTRPIVIMGACYSGRPEDGEKLVAPIKSFGKPIGDMLMRRPYIEVQSLLDRTQPKGRRNYWKSEYLSQIEPAFCEKFIEHSTKIQSPHSVMFLMHIGGALNTVDENYSPVGNRDAQYVVNFAGSWERPDEDAVNIQWARNAWTDIRQFSTGGTYLNFLSEGEGNDRTQAAMGKSLPRLAEVKAKWDPENMFRANRNIEPAR